MTHNVPPRLRAPLTIVVGGAVVGAVTVAVRGWALVPVLILVIVIGGAAIGYYAWGGRDNDRAAAIRREMDERQAYHQLQIQALVGKVMSLATATAYCVAVAVNAPLWPFAAALSLLVATAAVGWTIYRDRTDHNS